MWLPRGPFLPCAAAEKAGTVLSFDSCVTLALLCEGATFVWRDHQKKGLRTRRKWTRELSVVLCLSLVLARVPVYVAVVTIMFFFDRAHRLPCNPLGGRGFITALNWPSCLSINFPFFFLIFFDDWRRTNGRNADRHVCAPLNKPPPRQTRRPRASREPRPLMREAARPAPHRWPVAAAAVAARSGVASAALRLRPRPRRRSRRNSTTFSSRLRSSPRSHPTAVSRCACS